MKKYRFSVTADAVFLLAGGWLIAFVLLRFRLSPLPAALCALAPSLPLALFSFVRRTKRSRGADLEKAEEKDCARLLEGLPLLSGDALDSVRRALSSTVRTDGREPICRFHFGYEPLGKDGAAEILRGTEAVDAVFATDVTEEAEALLRARGVSIGYGKDVYLALTDSGNLPPLPAPPPAPRLRDAVRATFRKRKAGRYLGIGAFLLLFALIVPYPVYYLASGSAFVLYALVCRLFGKEEK